MIDNNIEAVQWNGSPSALSKIFLMIPNNVSINVPIGFNDNTIVEIEFQDIKLLVKKDSWLVKDNNGFYDVLNSDTFNLLFNRGDIND